MQFAIEHAVNKIAYVGEAQNPCCPHRPISQISLRDGMESQVQGQSNVFANAKHRYAGHVFPIQFRKITTPSRFFLFLK
jgi:hypothetical protein